MRLNRRHFLAATTGPAILSASPLRAQTKPKVSYAYLMDPAYDAVVWAIKNGKVRSNMIDVEVSGLLIPQLLQVTSTKQYDVVMTAVIGVPAAIARGLDLRILSAALYTSPVGEGAGVWVKKGSALTSPSGLKGRLLASYGLRSTGYMYVREALRLKFGLNMALEGGDVRQVEVQAPNLPAALATGQADAATLIHSQAWRAKQSGDFVNICESNAILNERYGSLVSAVNVSYPDRLAQRGEHISEFNRMLKASITYALANRDEVFGAVAKQANIDRAFLDWWFDKTTSVPAVFGDEHAKAVQTGWNIGKDMGMINAVPDIKPLIWDKTLRS